MLVSNGSAYGLMNSYLEPQTPNQRGEVKNVKLTNHKIEDNILHLFLAWEMALMNRYSKIFIFILLKKEKMVGNC